MNDVNTISRTADIRETLLARAAIAARIFGWSEERHQAFNETVLKQEFRSLADMSRRRPAAFGIEEELWFSPGPEAELSPEMRVAFGRYEAVMAFESWCWAEKSIDQGTARDMASMYCDKHEIDTTDLDLVTFDPSVSISQLAELYDGDFEGFLSTEHRNAIEDGRNGYADLLLEKIIYPCVFRQYEDGVMDIADGWHRTAAALVAGDETVAAVVVPLPGCSNEVELAI